MNQNLCFSSFQMHFLPLFYNKNSKNNRPSPRSPFMGRAKKGMMCGLQVVLVFVKNNKVCL